MEIENIQGTEEKRLPRLHYADRIESAIENEALLSKPEVELTWITKIYFMHIGFVTSVFFYFLLVTMHYFKKQYANFTFSIYSMTAVKTPVFLLVPLVPLLSKVKLTLGFISAIWIFQAFLIGTTLIAIHFPNTSKSLVWCLILQAFGAFFALAAQAISLRSVLFYHYSSVSYFYASAVFGCLSMSGLGIVFSYSRISDLTFVYLMLGLSTAVVVSTSVMQLIMQNDQFYARKAEELARIQQVSFSQLKTSFQIVIEPASILLLTLTLTAITYRTVFYEIGPSNIQQGVWINITNIVVNAFEFIGRSMGGNFRLNAIVHEFHFYPFLYNIIINGLFIWNNRDIFDAYWGLFWPLIILLMFRTGFTVTYYQAKVAAKNPNDSNCLIIGNLSKEAGNAVGAIISVGVLALKSYLHA